MARLLSSFLFVTTFAAPCALLAAQTPTAAPASAAPSTPSALLKPALDNLQQTLGTLHPEKWKSPNAINQETLGNLSSIQADLQTTLPPLLAVADAHPGSLAQVLPAYRNIEALYDVLLRVTGVAKLAAPTLQSNALEQSLTSLEKGRRDLGDTMQSVALTQNQRLHDLQSQLHTLQSAPPPAPCPPPPPPPVVKKHKPRPKPAAQARDTRPGNAAHQRHRASLSALFYGKEDRERRPVPCRIGRALQPKHRLVLIQNPSAYP